MKIFASTANPQTLAIATLTERREKYLNKIFFNRYHTSHIGIMAAQRTEEKANGTILFRSKEHVLEILAAPQTKKSSHHLHPGISQTLGILIIFQING